MKLGPLLTRSAFVTVIEYSIESPVVSLIFCAVTRAGSLGFESAEHAGTLHLGFHYEMVVK